MFLKSIYLQNVKCFKDTELSFTKEDGTLRKWTFLLGENGTGKSTLMKAIALVTCGSEAITDLITDPNDWIRFGTDNCSISAVLVDREGEEININIDFKKGDERTDIILRNQESLKSLDSALKHSLRNYFVAGFGASRRISSFETLRQKTSQYRNLRAQSVATIFDPDASLNPLESWAMDLDYVTGNTGIKTVRRVLSEFLPDIKFLEIDKRKGRLLFETEDGIVPLRSLSDGYQSAAAWIGDLLYRVMEVFNDYRTPLKARALLLIDEVDLHLHPKWQRDLFSFLDTRLPNFQIVVSTHSPMTAQQAGPGILHYLTRVNRQVHLDQFTGDPRKLLISQLLMTDVFGIDSDESVEVQQKKIRYEELIDKEIFKEKEKSELEELKGFLSEVPKGGRSNLKVTEEHAQLMREIRNELKGEKS